MVDPGMDEWYEQPDGRAVGGDRCTVFGLRKARQRRSRQIPPPSPADVCLSILKNASQREWIRDNKLDNPCRRELRELDDMTARLSSGQLDADGRPRAALGRAGDAVPGEEIAVRVRVEGVPEARVRYALEAPPGWRLRTGRRWHVCGHGSRTMPWGRPDDWWRPPSVLSSRDCPSAGSVGQVARRPDDRGGHAAATTSPASGDDFHFAVDVSNNASSPPTSSAHGAAPGWQRGSSSETVDLEAKIATENRVSCRPLTASAKPGSYKLRAELVVTQLADAAGSSPRTCLFLPGSLNRLKNPGFERRTSPTGRETKVNTKSTTAQSHGGGKPQAPQPTRPSRNSSASQTIVLEPADAASRSSSVVTPRRRTSAAIPTGRFSIYVDIYYTDGTPLYGQTIDWQTGTTGWQHGEMTIKPAKPIRNVNVYLLLRGHSGTAWFDDVFVAENPRHSE